jgi:hypothetical protein
MQASLARAKYGGYDRELVSRTGARSIFRRDVAFVPDVRNNVDKAFDIGDYLAGSDAAWSAPASTHSDSSSSSAVRSAEM